MFVPKDNDNLANVQYHRRSTDEGGKQNELALPRANQTDQVFHHFLFEKFDLQYLV